jgi:hypothetical protein
MNRRYEVTIHDPESDQVDTVYVWSPSEAAAIATAQDLIDYRDKRNVTAGKAIVRIVGDTPLLGDTILKEE